MHWQPGALFCVSPQQSHLPGNLRVVYFQQKVQILYHTCKNSGMEPVLETWVVTDKVPCQLYPLVSFPITLGLQGEVVVILETVRLQILRSIGT